jgi:hypothetical protein
MPMIESVRQELVTWPFGLDLLSILGSFDRSFGYCRHRQHQARPLFLSLPHFELVLSHLDKAWLEKFGPAACW